METCSVPNCKLKSSTKSHSSRNDPQLNLWRKILKNNDKKFTICDQHISIFCQSCMISFESKQLNNAREFVVISEGFQETFGEVIGYEIPVGVVCSKCYNSVNNFAKFRKHVRTQQELRPTIPTNTSETQKEEPEEEYQIEYETDQNGHLNHNEDDQFEVVEYQDEEYLVEMKESDEYDEVNGLELKIKEQFSEDAHFGEEDAVKFEPMDQIEYRIDELPETGSFVGIETENPEAIIKVEPIEYEYSDLEYQIPSNDLQTEIELHIDAQYIPKISNPRTLPAQLISQNLKRKIINPGTSSASTISPGLVQASLRSALESSKFVSPATKRMKFPQRSLKCQYCPERFDNCDLILEHIENKHKFQCPICNSSFPFKINLIQHQFMDHKKSPKDQNNKVQLIYKHSCSQCRMKFSSSENLEIHMTQEHNVQLRKIMVYVEEEDKPQASLSSRILNSFKKAKPGPSGIKNIKKES